MGYSFVSKCNHTRKVMYVNFLCFSAIFAEQGFVEIQKFCYHGNATQRLSLSVGGNRSLGSICAQRLNQARSTGTIWSSNKSCEFALHASPEHSDIEGIESQIKKYLLTNMPGWFWKANNCKVNKSSGTVNLRRKSFTSLLRNGLQDFNGSFYPSEIISS